MIMQNNMSDRQCVVWIYAKCVCMRVGVGGCGCGWVKCGCMRVGVGVGECCVDVFKLCMHVCGCGCGCGCLR